MEDTESTIRTLAESPASVTDVLEAFTVFVNARLERPDLWAVIQRGWRQVGSHDRGMP